MSRLRREAFRGGEQGFTLPEMLVTIVVMGILLAIASGTWSGVVEGRTLDAAASQLSSDLRLANTRATNQLANWRVQVFTDRGDPGQVDYRVTRPSDGLTFDRSLPEGSMITTAGTELNVDGGSRTIRFRSDGSAEAVGGFGDADGDGQLGITVSVDGDPRRKLTVVPATSRVKIVL